MINNNLESLPYPEGWFIFCFSKELAKSKLLVRSFMGQEVIVFRTQSGVIGATDAYCPHLGAHFGYGGIVDGELLICPFHKFSFNHEGICVKTGYGTKPPPSAKLKTWPVCERNGMIFLYYSSKDLASSWQIPELDTVGWTKPLFKKFILNDHPQETTENSVDIGHFPFVHQYKSVKMLRDLRVDGVHLSTAYSAERIIPLFGRINPNLFFTFEFETIIYGLGYSLVNVKIHKLPLEARLWVLPSPINKKQITLYLASSIKSSKINIFSSLFAKALMSNFAHDTQQDFLIWENKKYINPPALAKGDGPIGQYRLWAKQFYSE